MAPEPWSVGILVFDGVEVLDFAGPFEVFSRTRIETGMESMLRDDEAPFRPFLVAKSVDPVTATGGLRVVPHYTFENAPAIDVLLVPGGFGTRPLMDDTPTLAWISARASAARLVTSVCTGSLLLARAGLLAGRRATTHWAALDILDTVGPDIQVEREARFVDDGIVTSAGVAAGIDMAFYVVEKRFGKEVADRTAHYIDYPRSS